MKSFREFIKNNSIKKKLKKAGLIALMALSLASCAPQKTAFDVINEKAKKLDLNGKELNIPYEDWKEMKDLMKYNFPDKAFYHQNNIKDEKEKAYKIINDDIFDMLNDIEREIVSAEKELIEKGVDKEFIQWYKDTTENWTSDLINRLNKIKNSDSSLMRKYKEIKFEINSMTKYIKDFKYETLAKNQKLNV